MNKFSFLFTGNEVEQMNETMEIFNCSTESTNLESLVNLEIPLFVNANEIQIVYKIENTEQLNDINKSLIKLTEFVSELLPLFTKSIEQEFSPCEFTVSENNEYIKIISKQIY